MNRNVEVLIEEICRASHVLGRIIAMEELSSKLMTNAQEFFSSGNDVIAKVFRDESLKLVETSKELRISFEKQERKLASENWKILDENIPNSILSIEERV